MAYGVTYENVALVHGDQQYVSIAKNGDPVTHTIACWTIVENNKWSCNDTRRLQKDKRVLEVQQ